MSSGKVVKVSGPLVVATGLADANMADVVRVGEQRLIGEILTMTGDAASIQVYEETSGLGPGAEVETTGAPLSRGAGPRPDREHLRRHPASPGGHHARRSPAPTTCPGAWKCPPWTGRRSGSSRPRWPAGRPRWSGGDIIGTVQETPVDPPQDHGSRRPVAAPSTPSSRGTYTVTGHGGRAGDRPTAARRS